MHISEGVLSAPVLASGAAVAAAGLAVGLKKLDYDRLPQVGILAAVFFVASLVHVPLGPTSAHLVLNGLVGVVLGAAAFPAILLGLVLQALLFQHGGLTTIGVNTVVMGIPALAARGIFASVLWIVPHRPAVAGFTAGAAATLLSGLLLALCLATAGHALVTAARLALAVHLPLALIEAAVTAGTVRYLVAVRPDLLP